MVAIVRALGTLVDVNACSVIWSEMKAHGTSAVRTSIGVYAIVITVEKFFVTFVDIW